MSPKLKLYTILGILAVIIIGIVGYGAYTGVGPDTAATVGKIVIKKSEAKALKDANVGFSTQSAALEYLVDEASTSQIAAKHKVEATNADTNAYTKEAQGVETASLTGFALRQAKHETLKRKLTTKALGEFSGKYLAANFDYYIKNEFTRNEDVLALTDDEASKLLAAERTHADSTIKDLKAKLDAKQMTFAQATASLNRDTILGTGSTSRYQDAPVTSGSFSPEDYSLSKGVFEHDPLVKAKVAALKPNDISGIVTGRDNYSTDTEEKFVDARFLVFTVTSRRAGLTSQSFDEWYKDEQAKLPVRQFTKLAGAIGVDVAEASDGRCSSDKSKWGIHNGNKNSGAGLIVQTKKSDGTWINNVNFTVKEKDGKAKVNFSPNGVYKSSSASRTTKTGETIYCNSSNNSDVFSSYAVYGWGLNNAIGDKYDLNCRNAVFQITDVDPGPGSGSWGNPGNFTLTNGGTRTITLIWTPSQPAASPSKLIVKEVGVSLASGENVFTHVDQNNSNHRMPADGNPYTYTENNGEIYTTVVSSETSFVGLTSIVGNYQFDYWAGPCDNAPDPGDLFCDVTVDQGGAKTITAHFKPIETATLNVKSVDGIGNPLPGPGFDADCGNPEYSYVGTCGTTDWTTKNKGREIVEYVTAPDIISGQSFWYWEGCSTDDNDGDPNDGKNHDPGCDAWVDPGQTQNITAHYRPGIAIQVDSYLVDTLAQPPTQAHFDSDIDVDDCANFNDVEGTCGATKWKMEGASGQEVTLSVQNLEIDVNGTTYYCEKWMIYDDNGAPHTEPCDDGNGNPNLVTVKVTSSGSPVLGSAYVYFKPTIYQITMQKTGIGDTGTDNAIKLNDYSGNNNPCVSGGDACRNDNDRADDDLIDKDDRTPSSQLSPWNTSMIVDVTSQRVTDSTGAQYKLDKIEVDEQSGGTTSLEPDDPIDVAQDPSNDFSNPQATIVKLFYTKLTFQLIVSTDPGNVEFKADPSSPFNVDPGTSCSTGYPYTGTTTGGQYTIEDNQEIQTCGGGYVTFTAPSTYEADNKIYQFKGWVPLDPNGFLVGSCDSGLSEIAADGNKIKVKIVDPTDCSGGIKAVYQFKQFKIIEGR